MSQPPLPQDAVVQQAYERILVVFLIGLGFVAAQWLVLALWGSCACSMGMPLPSFLVCVCVCVCVLRGVQADEVRVIQASKSWVWFCMRIPCHMAYIIRAHAWLCRDTHVCLSVLENALHVLSSSAWSRLSEREDPA